LPLKPTFLQVALWDKLEAIMDSLGEYLKPTYLCDFDQVPNIGDTATRLTEKLEDKREMFKRIYRFVKELPYGLEDWDVKTSDTLRKRWGMCSGKTSLLVAMLRSLGIPARYRISKIKPEGTLWRWVASRDGELARQMGNPSPEQDHVMAEVYIDGWEACDPSRDPAFEEGLRRLGIPLERKLVTDPSGNPQSVTLASIDKWAENRQRARRFRENRRLIFSRVNEQFDRIRSLGGR